MKKKMVGLLLLTTAFCVPLSGQTMQQWRDSLAVLNRLIAASPELMELHLRKAAVNIELRQWEYAADEYTLVLSKDAKNPAAHFYRAYTNLQLKRYDQALYDYDELLRQSPLHFEGRLGHAHVQQKLGRRMEALEELNLMVEMFPDSAAVYAARAGLEAEMKQTDLALFDWERCEQLDSLNADYTSAHADLLIQQQRNSEARQVLDAAVARGVPRGLLQTLYVRSRKKTNK